MESIKLVARAKINLSLDVLHRRPDGYHTVRMIMTSIGLHDNITLTPSLDAGVSIVCEHPHVPSDHTNIAYKAAVLFKQAFDIKDGISIKIEKNIPVAAGLAGGSTNAAAVLKGMRTIFCPNVCDTELLVLGKQLGADVPYCIKGGTMLAEGIGTELTELPGIPRTSLVLVKPRIGVSTAWVYKNLDLAKVIERPDTEAVIKAMRDKNIEAVAKNMKNVLESVTVEKHAVINEIKTRLVELGALGSVMSGSGPTVFGIFKDSQTACEAYSAIKDDAVDCFVTETICEER